MPDDDDEDQEVLYDRGDQDFWDDESDKPRMRVVFVATLVIMVFLLAALTWVAVQVFT